MSLGALLPSGSVRGFGLSVLLLLSCTPAAQPAPTSAPAKPAAPAAPAAAPATSAPAAKPAEGAAKPAEAAKPADAAAKPAAAGDWDKVVAEANKEGEVIVWDGAGADARAHDKDAFEKAYPGIKVTLFQAPSSSERDSRFLQEFQSGVAKVDLLISGSGGMNARLKTASSLQDVRPFLAAPDVSDPKSWAEGKYVWVDKEEQFIMQSDVRVNPPLMLHESVDPNEVKSWQDLLAPKWEGKIVMMDPRKSGKGFSGGLFMYYAPGLGPEYTKQFFQKGRVVFSQDERQNAEWVSSGRALIGIRPEHREVTQLQKVGSKMKLVPILNIGDRPYDSYSGSEGILAVPNLNPLPHPNATRVYVNWFYGKAGQQAMVDIYEAPSRRTDVDHSKMPEFLVPKAGVSYMNLNQYTENDVVQKMRDDVTQWYGP